MDLDFKLLLFAIVILSLGYLTVVHHSMVAFYIALTIILISVLAILRRLHEIR